MAAATDVGSVDDDLDYFNIDDFDFDFDLFAEAYPADTTTNSSSKRGCGCGGDGDGAEAGSPDSAVTDGPLVLAADGDGKRDMTAYVAELERFLLDDNAPYCGEQGEVADPDGLLSVVDDYFGGDQLLAIRDPVVVPTAGTAGAGRTNEEEENADGGGDVLAAREDGHSTSRKRARGTAMLTPWGELEVMDLMMMHLGRKIQMPAAACRLFSCAACRMQPSGLIT